MSQRGLATALDNASTQVLKTASVLCPSSFSMIPDGDEPVQDYARRLYSPNSTVTSSIGRDSRLLLANAVAEHVRRVHRADGEKAAAEVRASPVLQTGPHHRLAFDDDFCSTLALSLTGSAAAGRAVNLLFSCSTITLEEHARRGPAWLRISTEPIRVFDIPRRTLSKKSVLAFGQPVRLSDELRHWISTRSGYGVRIDLSQGSLRPVREHISQINDQFFAQLHDGTGVMTVALQEDFFARLLADTLDQPSLLRRFVEDGRLPTIAARLHAAASDLAGCFVPVSTDLFWAVADGRVRPLQLIQGCFRSARYHINVPSDAAVLARHLRAGTLVPNLFMVFCVASILPVARALGGSYQAAYHEAFQRVILDVLDPEVEDERKLIFDISNHVLAGWGHNVIAHNALHELIASSQGGLRFSDRLASTSLLAVSNGLSAFTADERWRRLAAMLEGTGIAAPRRTNGSPSTTALGA